MNSPFFPERQEGLTFIELIVTLLVVALMLGVGVPGFNNLIDTNRMAGVNNEIVSTLHMARSEAVKQRSNVTVCASASWNSTTPTCDPSAALRDGWIVFTDGVPPTVANGTVDVGETVLKTHGPIADTINTVNVDADVTLHYVSFAPTGFTQQIGAMVPVANIVLCDRRGNKDTGGGVAAGRFIRIAPTGRPQTYRMKTDVQASPIGGC